MFGGKLQLQVVSSIEGAARTWINRATGAAVRAFLVMVLIVLPSVILPGIGTDTKQIVALVALFAGALVFVEYNAVYPSLVEFRDGAPFNRIRYLMLLAIVLSPVGDRRATGKTRPRSRGLFHALGVVIGEALDFPYSPVRLATLHAGRHRDRGSRSRDVRTAAGTAYLISLLSLAVFVIVLKIAGWPSTKSAFNVWVNLPTFEPTAGGDVVDRLERDARVNLAVGFLLPFVVPALIARVHLGPAGDDPHLAADADLDDGGMGLPAGQPADARGRDGADRRHDPHQARPEDRRRGRGRPPPHERRRGATSDPALRWPLLALPAARPSQAETLRIATWNVGLDRTGPGLLVQDLAKARRPADRRRGAGAGGAGCRCDPADRGGL